MYKSSYINKWIEFIEDENSYNQALDWCQKKFKKFRKLI